MYKNLWTTMKAGFTNQFYSIKKTINIDEALRAELFNQLSPKFPVALCE